MIPPPVPRQAPTRDRPYGSIPCGEDVHTARSFVASRVGVGDDSPRPCPARRPEGIAPTVSSPAGKISMRRGVGGVVAWGWAMIPPRPCPARRPQGIAPTVSSPAGKMSIRRARSWRRAWGWAMIPPPVLRQAPTRDCPYGSIPCGEDVHTARGLVASSRGGGRRFPTPCPARRPEGIAPTVSSPAGKMSMRRAGWWRRAWGWAMIPHAVPRQAPTRDCPYGSISCGEDVHAARGASSRGGGRRFPPPVPRQAPRRDCPYGSIPCGEDVHAARGLVASSRGGGR